MMKIQDLLSLPIQQVQSGTKPAGEADFAQCLKEAVSGSQTAKDLKVENISQLPGLTGVGEISRAPEELVEATLSRMEVFQEALSRPEISLKSLSPLAQSLEADSHRLQAVAQKMPSDSPLRQVVEETAALSWVESFKFQRGDYI
jgi:hypothetical protein